MKILVVQTAFIGDCVLTLPLINTIKDNVESSIDVISLPSTAEIFRSCSSVEHVIEYDKKGSQKGLRAYLNLIDRIKKRNYDIAFLPQRSFKSGLLAFLAKIPKRFALSRGGAKFLATDVSFYDWKEHELDRILSLTKLMDIDNYNYTYRLNTSVFAKITSISDNTDRKIIGICSQSEWFTKCWPRERYHELAKRLSSKYQIVIFGKEKENIEGDNIINLTASTDMKELISLINILDILICNDTGPLHMGAALGKTIVAIFGPTSPPMGFTPVGVDHTIVEVDLKCRPCSLHGGNKCPKGHFKCMKQITVDMVETAVLDKLK